MKLSKLLEYYIFVGTSLLLYLTLSIDFIIYPSFLQQSYIHYSSDCIDYKIYNYNNTVDFAYSEEPDIQDIRDNYCYDNNGVTIICILAILSCLVSTVYLYVIYGTISEELEFNDEENKKKEQSNQNYDEEEL